jgi:hypothetical protein
VAVLAVTVHHAAAAAQYGGMRNGTFDQPQTHKPDDQAVIHAGKAGWKLPDDLVWPAHWGPNPSTGNSTLEYLPKAGLKGTPAVRLDGGGHIASYFGRPEPGRPYVATIRVRGKGKVWFSAYRYSADGFIGSSPSFVEREIDTENWAEYRGLFLNNDPAVVSINPALGGTGPIEADEVGLVPAEPIDVEIVRELVQLYGTGALVEDLAAEAVRVDEAFQKRLAEYTAAVAAFRADRGKANQTLAQSLEKKAADLDPYLTAAGKQAVPASCYNEMVALTQALKRLLGQETTAVGGPKPEAIVSSAPDHKPGVRKPRPDTVTVTDIRSNKVRYDEGETATTKATIINKSAQAQQGTLVARIILDLDTARQLTRAPLAIGPGETKTWSFSYSVGPETYGRAIEVSFVGADGTVVDRWQEYYAVAREYFRVMQHTYHAQNELYKVDPWTTYLTHRHYFASEPTDLGVRAHDAEVYKSGQAGYQVNQAARRAEIDWFAAKGVTHTFYQTFAFCGQMGYEEMRRRPEYILYDANGQPAVDPIYGGYPNPLELASPLEVGPKRVVTKPHLDRTYTPWQHCAGNFASQEVLLYQTECIGKYAKEHGFDGVYIDGNMGVLKGFTHEGKPNVPSGEPQDFARLSARNHRLFSKLLKTDDPNFGIWYNWGCHGVEWSIRVGLTSHIGSGTGVKGDAGDENIRAATEWPNVMLLYETGSFLKSSKPDRPAEFFDKLIAQRDFAVQKWGANSIIGYSFVEPHVRPEAPGPANWAWPTLNYLGAQLIATQQHYAAGFLPSYRPMLQFTTRYSGLVWSPDAKVVSEAHTIVNVSSPEEVWWKRLVYRRQTDEGYDLIVHLVRVPPFPRWDINWVDAPEPLTEVTVTAQIAGQLQTAQACRPYDFGEPQQVVQSELQADVREGKATVKVPSFRYHTMVVFRLKA